MTGFVASVVLGAVLSSGANVPGTITEPPARSGSATAQTEADEIRRRVREGQKIVVVDEQGRELRGRIGELKPDALTLLVGRDRTDVSYDRILRIDRPRDGVSDGAIKGLTVGVVMGLVAGLAAAGDDSGFLDFDFSEVATIAVPVLGGIGAGIGLGLDALIRREPNLYRRPIPTRISLSPVAGRTTRGVVISVSW